ncbi:tannase subunit [Truncatella angustata]|uniref:Carboxylic ester hydrolase n=1 Tax=Truncatella angustata TaxID=152316 RepID=A0A9P8UHX7_9PEZI|nr:tannase subunit [Truncatella angustata]KAH6652423.1 tannase subunit [Truncatella angustata]
MEYKQALPTSAACGSGQVTHPIQLDNHKQAKMPSFRTFAATVLPVVAQALTLDDICTTEFTTAALPAVGFYPGITIDATSVSTEATYNVTVESEWYPTSTINYCNVTFAYSHDAIEGDLVHVSYWLPAPDQFNNRYVSTGGGGLAINSQSQFIPTGIIVGAVSGITDGGFGDFNTQWDAAFLESNGTINWEATYMFGFQAHHELATLGKQFTKNLYDVKSCTKLFAYYQGCSEGGREGWSQAQRYAEQFDGYAIGAPAFRYGQQQVNHLTSNVIEQTLNYYPPTCELDKIVNLTIAACDTLDGKADGVISRSDLCKLTFDVNSTIGEAYTCEASAGNPIFGQPTTPAQSGVVTAEGAAVASAILAGLHDSEGRFVYLSYQPGATFEDAATAYNETTDSWGLSISGLGGEWVAKFLELRNVSTLESLDGYTYDTLKDLMIEGYDRYYDVLQTTYTNISSLDTAGTKILHIHGEQDNSIPTGSSVRYYDSVRTALYPSLGYNESTEALDDFYRLFLVPGGAHCGANSFQPNGGWPQTTLQTIIDWVEKGIAPDTLANAGTTVDSICKWPMRPLWDAEGTLTCEYDQASIDSWTYDFNAYDFYLD